MLHLAPTPLGCKDPSLRCSREGCHSEQARARDIWEKLLDPDVETRHAASQDRQAASRRSSPSEAEQGKAAVEGPCIFSADRLQCRMLRLALVLMLATLPLFAQEKKNAPARHRPLRRKSGSPTTRQRCRPGRQPSALNSRQAISRRSQRHQQGRDGSPSNMGKETPQAATSRSSGVTGTLQGKKGSFVLLLHDTTMFSRRSPNMNIYVVPDSGTDELKGISGKMKIVVAPRRQTLPTSSTTPSNEVGGHTRADATSTFDQCRHGASLARGAAVTSGNF